MKLSIIIPFYNVEPYTDELLQRLEPQITDDVEVIVIDDGSIKPYTTDKPWVKLLRHDNAGVSHTRNVGIDVSCGEYIAFIDADDLVADDYVKQIMDRMPFDYLEMSWRSLPGGQQFQVKLNNQSDRLSNPSAVTRVFSRKAIGNTRFNENKEAAEDAEFTSIVCKEGMKVAIITDFMYFYRTSTPNSLTKRYMSGDTDTKRIVYHYNHITADMTDLLNEIAEENKTNEVYVMTNRCDIPELYNHAKIMKPCKVRGMELRGEPWSQFVQIFPPPRVDIAIYTSQKSMSGIFTWIYSFCHQMSDKYSIMVLHDGMNAELIEKLIPIVDVRVNGDPIRCETLLMMRIGDLIPCNIRYHKSIQVLHSTRLDDMWTLPVDRDEIIPISNAVKNAWGISHEPILNMTYKETGTLHLISATRLKTPEKGKDRIKCLAKMLRDARIPFVWDCFSDVDPEAKGVTHHEMTTDIRQHIRGADYLVQLSDAGEGFCYSIVEALEESTAVLTTPIQTLDEIGFKDGVHGYVIPFDMNYDVRKILTIPKIDFKYDNEPMKKQWGMVFGESKNKNTPPLTIQCTKRFRDVLLDRYVEEGEVLTLNARRAEEIIAASFGKKLT